MIDAPFIAESLDLKRYGQGWRGPCPVCGGSDKAKKLVIREDGDHVLVHCFAGCDQDSIVRN